MQPDPFAGPSRIRLFVPWDQAGAPAEITLLAGGAGAEIPGLIDAASARAIGWRDWIGRRVEAWLRSRGGGSGRRGEESARIAPYGQAILDRSAVLLRERGIEIRLDADLPARGRRILGRAALALLADTPERLVAGCLAPDRLDAKGAAAHAATVEDHAALRDELARRGWLAFVADGSCLARRAGNDDRPLPAEGSVPFESPPSLRRELRLPHAGLVRGLAIEPGVTLLCGGGFHGKSTLLRALAAGVGPHVAGDGRERVAVRDDAVVVRAEDGRAVHEADLRPFLHDLPFGRAASPFSTSNASGSTSQAAAIIESIEGGSRLLLFDEDTSATNFMIRDRWMDRLLAPHQEPITPYLDRARHLLEEAGVSSVLVIGGSGEYFRVADRVLVLDTYRPFDRTAEARAIAASDDGHGRRAAGPAGPLLAAALDPARRSLPRLPRGEPRIRALDARRLLVGTTPLELPAAEALRDPAQGRFLAQVLAARDREQTGAASGTLEKGPAGLLDWYLAAWRAGRLDRFGPEPRGDLAAVRGHEVLAAVNRLRTDELPSTEGRPEAGSSDT